MHWWSLKVITSRADQSLILESRRAAEIVRSIIDPPAPRLSREFPALIQDDQVVPSNHASPLLYLGAGSWPPQYKRAKSHPFPFWKFFPEGERAQFFFRPSPDFLGYLLETLTVVAKTSPISSWRGENPFSSGFSPRFPGGTCGC